MLHCAVLYGAELYRNVLCCTVLCHAVLSCVVLCRTAQDLYDISAYILYQNFTIPEKWGGGKQYY